MHRRQILGALAVSTLAEPLQADLAQGNPRLQRLFSSFMAPCCWRENLSVHQSPKAEELRAQIRKDVSQGLSDEQIKEKMLAEFSTRILANPEGPSGLWLKYAPWAFTGLGLAALTMVLRSSLAKAELARQAQSASSPNLMPAPLPDSDWE
jgi:cytochrome c-type biogenesis protein CcmH/NrfF